MIDEEKKKVIDELTEGLKQANKTKIFDPESEDYDYETAKKYKIKPDKTGHYPSREPKTGLILKGRKHKTWNLTEEGEKKAGYKIIKKANGRYYSVPINIKEAEKKKFRDEEGKEWDLEQFDERRYWTKEKKEK